MQILTEISRSDLDFAGLAEIIQREMSLSYKLLRYISSAFFRDAKTRISRFAALRPRVA
jgi:c-di-GMP-related signal transduction protein